MGIAVALDFGLFKDVGTIAQATAILRSIDHAAARLLGDPLHLDRSVGRASQIADVPGDWLGYAQPCDAGAARPAPDDKVAIIHEAVYERLLCGEGSLDLRGVMSALPPGVPLNIEMRAQALYDAYPDGKDRACALADRTRAFLHRLEARS